MKGHVRTGPKLFDASYPNFRGLLFEAAGVPLVNEAPSDFAPARVLVELVQPGGTFSEGGVGLLAEGGIAGGFDEIAIAVGDLAP
ncbi:hypothetical protein A6U87_20765 [Rhizobium sp. AC44/96]|nr:hypothetical protein A6U87_20765 [Rhizobium sp. AC44/96]